MQGRPLTDPHLQYPVGNAVLLNSFMTKTSSHSHGGAIHEGPFHPSSGPALTLPHAHAQPLPHGMLPEDAMRRESRSVPPHLFGSRNQGPSGIPEGECAAAAAAQLLFADKGIPGVGSGMQLSILAQVQLLLDGMESAPRSRSTFFAVAHTWVLQTLLLFKCPPAVS